MSFRGRGGGRGLYKLLLNNCLQAFQFIEISKYLKLK